MKYKQNLNKYLIKEELSKTNNVVLGSNGNRGIIKRTLYQDENGNLYAKYFGSWWKYPQEIENYGVENKTTEKVISVNFDNLGQDLTKSLEV